MPVIEIDNFRKKYPDYNDIDDMTLASKLAEKYPDSYGDLPQKVGMSKSVVMLKPKEKIGTNVYSPDFLKPIKENFDNDLYKKTKNALSIAATHDIAPDLAMDITEEYIKQVNEPNLYEKALGSFKAGYGDIYSSIGGYLKRKGIAPTIADFYLDWGNKLKHAYIPPSDQSEFTWRKMIDPEWYATTAIRSVPFGLSLIPAAVIGAYGGTAVAGAVGLGAFGTTVCGAVGGAALTRPLESAFEGQGAYDEAIEKGISPEEAEAAADQVFWNNMKLTGLDAAQFTISFLPMGKVAGATGKRILNKRILSAVGKLSTVGLMEAAEERYQEKAVMDALNDSVSFFDMGNSRLNEASAAGAVFGVGLAGTGSVFTALKNKVTQTMPQPVKQIYEQAKEKGMSDIEALDAVAETPEGKQHIEDVVTELKDLVEGKEPKKTVEQIISETQTDESDLETRFNRLIESKDEITDDTLSQFLSDAVLEGEQGESSGEGVSTQNQETTGLSFYLKDIEGVTDKYKDDPAYKSEAGDDRQIARILDDHFGELTPATQQYLEWEAPGYDFESDTKPKYKGFRNADELTSGTENVHGGQITLLKENVFQEEYDKSQPQKSVSENINLLKSQKGEIDITPLVDIGRSVWLEGKQTFEQFYARIKEIAGDVWDKVKDYVRQAWDVLANERGSISTKPKSLYEAVKKAGGLDPEYIKQFHNWKDDIQGYGLVNLTKKGGRALDDLATELQSQGILDLTPDEYAGPGDYLLSELKRESETVKKKGTEFQGLTDEEKAAIKELEGQWRSEGATEDEIKEVRIAAQEIFDDKAAKKRGAKTTSQSDLLQKRIAQLRSVIPTDKVKTIIRRNTGQTNLSKLVYEDEALNAAFKKAAQAARIAYREGNKAGVEEQQQVIRKILDRRKKVRTIRDYFGLSDDDLKKITRRNPLLMSDQEFHNFLKDVQEEAVYLAEKAQAKFELMLLIESRRFKKWDNYREAMGLPSIHKMNTKQLGDFYTLLEPYEQDDTFLGKREIETVDKTDLAGIRTWREAREKLAQELNVPIQELATVHVGALDSFRWDTALREQNMFYQLLVDDMTKAMMGADMLYHNTESKAYELAKKSEKSRKRSLIERAIPQDEKIMNFLESPDDIKEMLARDMTPEQLDYAHFMQEYFANALDYLLATKALEKGRENYITHVRKTFLESVKDDGLIQAFKNMWKNYQEDEAVFKILDDDTGKILPLEKFFQFALHRTGHLDPTTNVTKAFLQYARTFERKKMFDAIIPKMDIYAQSLTPEIYTATGLETDRTLKKFVYQYVNNKKGRRLSYDGALKQGGKIDVAIRALRTFTSLLDLGLSPIVQTATFVGEQAATAAMLGPVNITKATARIKTEKGRRILKKYEVFTGRSFWEEFTAPGKQITERLTETMFAGFHASMKLANEQFLLGSLTEQEWNSEEISPERLAEMKLEMGRFRLVPETQSLVGSTSVGNAVMQYKAWAVSLTRSTIQDMTTLLSDLKNKGIGEALTTREVKELIRIAGITGAVLIVGAMAEADSDDDSFIGKMKARAYREAMSLTQGMDPTFWLATPRLLTWLFKTAQALKQIVTLEEYKNKPGLKGVENLKKQVVPRTLRLIGKEESQGGRR
jgi:hypothetical protein